MPKDLAAAPLGPAIVELVLRMARTSRWKWPTVASALSATASALKLLPLYSNARSSINIMEDSAFAAASRRAQHLARVATVSSLQSQALTQGQYEELLASMKHAKARLLLQLCWAFAARTGDMRQIHAGDVVIQQPNAHGRHAAAITFRFGKGAAFWGPYTIHAIIPAAVAKGLIAASGDGVLFNTYDQQILSEAIHELDMDLRAIRKGALQSMSRRGASDDQLQLLSGHKRKDTLMRYLGWGLFSHSASNAAAQRDALVTEAEEIEGGSTAKMQGAEAPKMGLHSGVVGNHGRRLGKPPQFFSLQAPSRKDLGIVTLVTPTTGDHAHSTNPHLWPLHVKEVRPVDWKTVELAVCSDLPSSASHLWHSTMRECATWCCGSDFYGSTRTYQEKHIPFTHFSNSDVEVMVSLGKIEPHLGPIMGYAKGHVIPIEHKRRRRPVFEPSINDTAQKEHMPNMQYPSRHERRTMVKGNRFVADFDFATFFDQFLLAESVRPYYVIRVRTDEGDTKLFHLCRMPMGANFAPSVAQAVTWGLLAPVVALPGVTALTMIDNVRIASNDQETFLKAVHMFLLRVKTAGIALNPMEPPESDHSYDWYSLTDTQLLQYALLGNKVFLGEHFVTNLLIKNSAKNVGNLHEAWRLFDEFAQSSWQAQEPEGKIVPYPQRTTRNVCALLSLCFWLCHTLGDHISQHYSLLRAYSSIVMQSCASSINHMSGWDTPLPYVAKSLHANIQILVERLLRNEPVEMPERGSPPVHDNSWYDLIIFVDACTTGLGAYVVDTHSCRTVCLRQRWHGLIADSATSEPTAVCRVLAWVKRQPFFINRREQKQQLLCAIVTDHIAMVSGQRRWRSYNGGFSAAWTLNSAFLQSQQDGISTDFFYVEGELNIADGPSRDPTNREELAVTHANILIPSLEQFWHPYGAEHEERPQWQV